MQGAFRRRWQRIVIGCTACFHVLAVAPAAGSAWTLPRGTGQAITTLRLYRSSGGFDDLGQPVPAAHFRRTEFASYIEYGLARGLTIGMEPRYEIVASGAGSSRQSNKAPGDLDFFVRKHIADYGVWTTAVQALVKFPLYSRTRQPLPGNGAREYEIRAAVGRNGKILRMPSFLNAEIAYRRGSRGIADQMRADVVLGLRPMRGLQVLVKQYRTRSVSVGSGAPGSSYDLDKAELSAVMTVLPYASIEVGASRDLAGQRIGLGNAVFGGIWLKF